MHNGTFFYMPSVRDIAGPISWRGAESLTTIALFILLGFHLLFCRVFGCEFEKGDSPGTLLTVVVV